MSQALRLQVQALTLHAGAAPHARLLFEALDFDAHGGERWIVLGPNGAGKSSLLAALAGIFPIQAGRVALQGRSLTQWGADELAQWRAWCPQFWSDPFPSTVAETASIAMRRGPWWWRATRNEAALQPMLQSLDLTALADADVRHLSGGERQRVAIATALLQDTPLVLLDEPASHLDLAHQHRLVRLLVRISEQGRTVIASLHDLNLAWDLATHAVLLDGRGGAVGGPREEVMTPAELSRTFAVEVNRAEVGGQTRWWIGPADRDAAA